MVRFLRQWFGYSLTETREHALVFVFGPGGNGKSVFLNVMTGILGDYAATATMDAFIASHGDRHSTDVAMLRGSRLVTCSETEEGRQWAEARIKQLTGGDPITARFMRQDNFTYVPQFKLTIVGNHRPLLRTVDDAQRRRFNLVPFTHKPASPDRELERKLRADWPAILRWAIDGCADWRARAASFGRLQRAKSDGKLFRRPRPHRPMVGRRMRRRAWKRSEQAEKQRPPGSRRHNDSRMKSYKPPTSPYPRTQTRRATLSPSASPLPFPPSARRRCRPCRGRGGGSSARGNGPVFRAARPGRPA